MKLAKPLGNDKGMALVLTLTLAGLLSLLGVWMILQSKTAFRVTTATTRYESVFNLAEAALQLSLRSVRMNTPYPSSAYLNSDVPVALSSAVLPDYISQINLGNGTVTPEVYYTGYAKTPPAGWSLNWQGYSAFHSVNYMCRGEGTIELPSSQGDATTAVISLATRVTQ
ncbi:MAG: hypothetical protein RBS57_10940 [Desulforhabdus sp.]|jgi:hypothetical protein|nr:hypothetical protein [Desulforhabdus sp.]